MALKTRKFAVAGALAVAALWALPATAKVDLVTLPTRDSSQITIYNSVDLTLARETRTLSFSKGKNEIQFSWANTLIDPTSLRINVDSNPGLVVLDAVYPSNTRDLIVWNIEAEEDTSAAVEISYFLSGLSWDADYVVVADGEEKTFKLQQFTTVHNNSGEDFENTSVRVVVGEVNLVELIADLARRGIQMDMEDLRASGRAMMKQEMDKSMVVAPSASAFGGLAMADAMEAKEIIKKAVSEYYIFAVEGQEDIRNGWGKELPNPEVTGIPFDLSYEIDPNKYGNQAVKFYKLKNDTKHELGKEPLPNGMFYVYSSDGRGGLRLEGRTDHKYVPIGEDVELNLGSDGLVLYEQRLMSMNRSNFQYDNNGNIIGWDETREVVLEIKNSRDREVPLKLTHYLSGDWEFKNVSVTDYERLDRNSLRWEFPLPPKETTTIEYTVVEHMGSLAKTR